MKGVAYENLSIKFSHEASISQSILQHVAEGRLEAANTLLSLN